jgi:hypothetical protein
LTKIKDRNPELFPEAQKKAAGHSSRIIEISLVSPSGLIIAASEIPAHLWQGDREIWKLWTAARIDGASV